MSNQKNESRITRSRVKNNHFIVFFSDRKLNNIYQEDIYGFEYQLGVNQLLLLVSEFDDIKNLKILDKYFQKYVDITLYVSKNPIDFFNISNGERKENYYSIMFKKCKLRKIFNEGTKGDNSCSTIDLSWTYKEYEIRY